MTADLVDSLVADHKELYQVSPSFKMAIDQLARSLPLWVDGFAREAHSEGRIDTSRRDVESRRDVS